MAVTPVFRRLSREAAALHCLIARRRKAVWFSWQGKEWSVVMSTMPAVRSGLTMLAIDWGGARLNLGLDESWIVQVAQGVVGIDNPSLLDGDLRELLIEAAMAEIAERIERTTRKRFALLGEVPAPTTQLPYWYQLQVDDGSITAQVALGMDETGLAFFADTLRRLPVEPANGIAWQALPVPVRFRVGWTALTPATLHDVKRRDVILLDECWISADLDRIHLAIGERFGTTGVIAGRTITLTEPLETIMEDIDDREQEAMASFGELTVRLSFDLGERILPLGDLMTIGPGHVFDLGRELRRAVHIRANGRVIGEGELVDIDGQVGVSVLRLEPPSGASQD